MHTPLIYSIKSLLKRNWCVSIRYLYREANFTADFLVKNTGSLPLDFHVFQEPPAGLDPWLSYDIYVQNDDSSFDSALAWLSKPFG